MTPEQIAAAMPQIERHAGAHLLPFPVLMIGKVKRPAEAGWQSKVWDLGMLGQALEHRQCIGYGLTLPKNDPRRLIVMDLDDGADPAPGRLPWPDRLAAVEAEHGPLPPTKTTLTPGGEHRWFDWPEGADLPKGSWHGFTVRSLHGAKNYVMGPGSVRADGGYVDADPLVGVATMPLALARSGGPDRYTNGHAEAPTISPGQRHDWLRDRARHYAGVLRDPDVLKAAVMAENAKLAEPKTEADVERAIGDVLDKFSPDPEPLEINKPVPAHLTRQSRAAWHFAQLAGDRVRFDHGRGRWLTWADHRWRPDIDGSVERLWLSVLADRYRDALSIADDSRTKALDAIQSAGATNGAITAGLEIASNMEPIATAPDAWDPDPWLLGCVNGVVDLRTGVLRDGRPEDMISRSTGVAYDPAATAPRWMAFLAEVFDDDHELIAWFGDLIGASLIGDVRELVAIHHGLGNNGKSVFMKTLRRAFGEYAVTIGIETLVNSKRTAGAPTPDIMPLRGARIAFTSEPDQSAKLRGGTLKGLASIDEMHGRGLHSPEQTWNPTHTIHLATNHLPIVEDVTDGFWRRIALIPWNRRFRKPGEEGDGPIEDPGLIAKLRRELPGILSWAVRGAVGQAAGKSLHPFPAAVRARTADYRHASDDLREFIAERVVYEKAARVGLRELHRAYTSWCDDHAIRPLDRLREKRFLADFEEHGKVKRDSDAHLNRSFFVGARLKTSTDGGNAESRTGNAGFSTFSSTREKTRNPSPTFRNSADPGEPDGLFDPLEAPLGDDRGYLPDETEEENR